MKIYKMEIYYIDLDELGPEGAKDLLENTHYPNHAPAPKVHRIEVREIEWSDGHPCNSRKDGLAACVALFDEVTP